MELFLTLVLITVVVQLVIIIMLLGKLVASKKPAEPSSVQVKFGTPKEK
jgi:hypothetical protein